MKITCLIMSSMLLISFAAGCQENPVEQYGTGLVDAHKKAEETAAAATLAAIRRSITAYKAANGENPASLNDIVAFMGVELDMETYDYDPVTGKVERIK